MNVVAATLKRVGEHRLLSEFGKYFVASLAALALDMSLFLVLARYMHYALAAIIGFTVGSVVHYLLSITFVFRRRRLAATKLAETAIFMVGGVVGLLVNVGAITAFVELFSTPLPVAKLGAAGLSFLSGYALRKLALF